MQLHLFRLEMQRYMYKKRKKKRKKQALLNTNKSLLDLRPAKNAK